MNENQYDNQTEISLSDIFKIIKRYFWFLVAITLAFGVAFGVYAYAIASPKYKATGLIIVEVKTSGDQVNTLESQRLIGTAIETLQSADIFSEKAAEELVSYGFEITPLQIRRNISITNSTSSLVVEISYITEDKELSKAVVEAMIDSFVTTVNDPSKNYQTLKDNITKVHVNEGSYHSPNKPLLVVIGLLLGGVLGLVLVFVSEATNNTFKYKEELEHQLNVQVLGVIPDFEAKRGNDDEA